MVSVVRNIDLKSVLKLTGAIEDKFDKTKWHTCQGVLSISGTKFINWNQYVGGGGAIDLIIHLKNYDFKTAVLWLSDNFPYDAIKSSPEIKNISKQELKIPKRDNTKLPKVVNYLVNVRCIPSSLIKYLINSHQLYADPRGNAVFLLLGKEKTVVGAELKGCNNIRWQGMSGGSKKDLGCFYIMKSKSMIVLCESAIDAISYFVLNPNSLAVSTSGANPNPVWLKLFINKGFDIYCGFDSDKVGDNLAKNMIDLYPTVRRLRPPKHDWNDVLINKIKR